MSIKTSSKVVAARGMVLGRGDNNQNKKKKKQKKKRKKKKDHSL